MLHVRPSELLGADKYMTGLECLLLDYLIVADVLERAEPSTPLSVSERVKRRRRGWHPPRMYA